jgi:uncharacterized protein (TIGR02145 family)
MKKTIYSLLTLVMGLVLSAGTCSGPDPVPTLATSITITSSPSPLNLTLTLGGRTGNVTAKVLPATANQGVTWTVSPPGVVSVNTKGNVTAIAVGHATIVATAQDGSGVSGAYDVNVVPVAVTGITLHLTATTRAPGATFKITETVLPAAATDKSVKWTSNNTGVATVDPNTGLITVKSTATAPLTCTITATTVSGGKVATCAITVAQNLSNADPGWGSSLGTVTRGSERKMDTQIWSDVVIASACNNKTSWNPGTSPNYLADGCRPTGATASPGTYFTWAAVIRYQDQLCPAPWRVPTKEDFVTLFQYLGGTTSGSGNSEVVTKLVLQTSGGWGGAYGGSCNSGGSLSNQGSLTYYWSQSEASATDGYNLYFSTSGSVYPQYNNFKSYGSLLRCVR